MAKIPPHAERVFKGVIFDVYQWQQEMFDGSVETFEMLKRPNTVMVLALQGDTIFYARQEQPGKPAPYLSLFGGRGEEGEEPLETAKRELLEETGMASERWHLLRTHLFPGKIDWTVYFFVAQDCKKIAEPKLDAGEKIKVMSCALDEFITTIVPSDQFKDYELRIEIMSAFNPDAITKLKHDILQG